MKVTKDQENTMFTRAAFALAIVAASVSGSIAAPHTQAPRAQAVDSQTVNKPGVPNGVVKDTGPRPAPTVFGWPYNPHRQ
jgi:hypothetical protein